MSWSTNLNDTLTQLRRDRARSAFVKDDERPEICETFTLRRPATGQRV
jgi:hypothetical protein